ncbi:nitrilase [Rhodobacter sp. Har01]|uniref:nitrilase-related carbon-nitrogen hydrolase n=1 Tax=Rhodobacter sp. Har01 TaxID=2883999 RepID=UPI001D063513|nr:nitrilase-related carbon-nitrogen hydrolase [Rhodobacter sp. Har01]MCB6177079.1 nitrilase [Rhodobacter sp. Har01]
MRLALLQLPSPAGDLDAACRAVEAGLAAAAAAGAAVLVTPELLLPGYNQPDLAGQALTADSPSLRRLAQAAGDAACALVIGYAERAGAQVYNAAACFGADGALLANYRKVQLYGPREKATFAPGNAYAVFPLAGETVALLICYDVEFSPHVKALSDRGVTVLLVPTANMQPFTHVGRATVPAMAANHGVSIAYANLCGTEGDLAYVGGSLIAGPHGEVLAQAGEMPALLVVDLPRRDPHRLSTQSADLRRIG